MGGVDPGRFDATVMDGISLFRWEKDVHQRDIRANHLGSGGRRHGYCLRLVIQNGGSLASLSEGCSLLAGRRHRLGRLVCGAEHTRLTAPSIRWA